jgi:hypothetical protein
MAIPQRWQHGRAEGMTQAAGRLNRPTLVGRRLGQAVLRDPTSTGVADPVARVPVDVGSRQNLTQPSSS